MCCCCSSLIRCSVNYFNNPSGASTTFTGYFFANASAAPGFQVSVALTFAHSSLASAGTCTLQIDGVGGGMQCAVLERLCSICALPQSLQGAVASKSLGTPCMGTCAVTGAGGAAILGMNLVSASDYGYGCLFSIFHVPCTAGYFCAGGSPAVICPAGSYCAAGVSAPTPCPAGVFGNVTGLSTASCTAVCPAGFFCPLGSSTPTPCLGECWLSSACSYPCPMC